MSSMNTACTIATVTTDCGFMGRRTAATRVFTGEGHAVRALMWGRARADEISMNGVVAYATTADSEVEVSS